MTSLRLLIVLTFLPLPLALADEKLGIPLEILLERLNSESTSEREVAAYGLGALRSPAAIEPLRERLKDENLKVRTAAAVALLQLGEADKPVTDALGAAFTYESGPLDLSSAGLKFRVEMRLIEMPPPAGTTVPALVGLLRQKDHGFSDIAASLLALYGSDAKDAVPELIQMLKRPPEDKSSRSSVVPSRAISALRAIGPAAEAALPTLEESMRSELRGVGVEAATAILAIRPDHEPALARVSQTIRAGETGRHMEYALALIALREQSRIRPKFVPVLIEIVGDRQQPPRERWQCIRLLGQFAATARDAVPILRRELRCPESIIRTHAAVALLRIDGTSEAEVLHVLRMALQEGSRDEADAVTKLFQEVPPRDAETISSLRKALRHSDYGIACQAAAGLLRADPADGEAKSLLLRLLKEGVPDNPVFPISLNMGSRTSAASAVARVGLMDQETRTALIDLLRHTEMLPVVVAADALRRTAAR